MCVSMDRAEFSGTTVYAGRRHHPAHGLIHVLGYQNTAHNLADGPNAMLLHLPALPMTRENFLSAGRCQDILTRMVDAVRPRPVAADDQMAWMGWEPRPAVEVFDHDVYTVLLAADATLIPSALTRVPRRKRPRIDPRLLEFYADRYPCHTLAVCCFDNADARRAKPLLMWYEPLEPDRLTVPALDCHTGGPPDPDAEVAVDHWVLFGTDEAPEGWGEPVDYPAGMRHELRSYLPGTVVGAYFGDRLLSNGDFAIGHDDLLAGDLSRVRRLRPG
ncbi:hypothetical protein PS467_03840 [Streptomyces luomodiensis]|uniref:Uncharacterized protein n=1 Tax=Streptomyces luomodiensis TaxID=3026192 RepID=A0ABY9URD6_9ACTN|nr:hypothetical protein [Streptomyces sp. SCA4-21]WNE94522.1 hypothetical protein PS467_03840 [Streptomyces sp. SCA4-21]